MYVIADFTRSVELIFGGKDNVSPTIKALSRNLDQFESSVGNLAAPLSDLGDSVLKIDAALGALGAVMVGFALNEASKFQSSFAEITTLFEATPEQIGQFSTDIQGFASTSTQSLESINGAIYSAISAGADYKDSLELLSQAEQLAVAGNADLDSSLTILLSSLNAFGLETDSAAGFADALFQAVKLGQTTLPELSSSLALVTGIAANAGVSFDELLATIAALTATGVPTSQAITGIKAAIQNIIKPTEQARILSEDLGINFNAAALESKGFAGVLGDVQAATGGSTEKMALLFGSTEALNIALSLTGTGAEKFAESLAAMANKAGAVEEAYKKMVNNLTFANQTLQNNIRLTFVSVGLKIIDQFTDDVRSLSDVFKALKFSVDDGAFDDIFAALNDFGANIETVLNNIAANLPAALAGVDFSGLLDAFGDLGGSIGNLFDNVDLNTAEGLRDVIQKIVDVGETLIRITDGMVESYKPLFDVIAGGIGDFNNLDDATKNNIGNLLGISQQVDRLLPVFTAMHGAVNALAASIGSLSAVLGLRGLAGALSGVSLAAVGTAAAFAPFGVAAAGAGAGVGTLINKLFELTTGTSIGSFLFDLTNDTVDVTASIRLAGKELGTFNETLQQYSDNARNSADDIGILNESGSTLAETFLAAGFSIDESSGAVTKLGDAVNDAGVKAGTAEKAIGGIIETMVDGVPTFTQSGKSISTSYKDIGTEADQAKEKSDQFIIKMEEIASNERIKNIEAGVNLNIAALEADAKIAVSIIETLNTTISSTGDLLGSLFGDLEGKEGLDAFAIKKQIALENENRKNALEQQKLLIDAQVKNLEAKTDALRNGEGLITITGDGLEPELEAFMMAVLSRIQIKAAEDQALYLLGLPEVA